MRLGVLCCEVFFREVCLLAANSPHTIDVAFLPKGLHDLGVDRMVPRLQSEIDAMSQKGYDALVMIYGLCNNGIVGLQARDTRLVFARAHDCITLFMGDRQRYMDYFSAHPGTYYRTTGWLEHADSTGAGEETVSQKLGLAMQYEELVRKYGEDNAQYLWEMLGDWTQNYDRLTYIHMGLECEGPFRDRARREAEERGWTFDEVQGSMRLLHKALYGEWDEDFLIVEPGQTVTAAHSEGIIAARSLDPG
jgi:hypothetical protein